MTDVYITCDISNKRGEAKNDANSDNELMQQIPPNSLLNIEGSATSS